MRVPTRTRSFAALSALALVVLTGCSGTDDNTSATGQGTEVGKPGKTSYPLTIDNCGTEVTFKEAPKRVLILNGSSVAEAESMIALGLEKSVIANAQSYGVSDDPAMVAKVAKLPQGGLSMNKSFDVPAEQVLKKKPDLVISTWSGGFDSKSGFATREQLAKAGINSLVNPTNCATGKADATQEEKDRVKNATVQASFDFLGLLGNVFDVQKKASTVTKDLQQRITAVNEKVKGKPAKKVLIAFPGMSAMTATGTPAVMAGGIYDDVIKQAGGVNAFQGKDGEFTRTLNKEALAAADVDLLATGVFTAQEKPAEESTKLFEAYPGWEASKKKQSVTVSDGVYVGPSNVYAIEKIAKALHPDAF